MTTPKPSSEWRKSLQDFLEETAQITKKILLLEIEGDQKQAKATVDAGIHMRGVRLWFLLASCLIASIGLNTNSSAVIIGAMLISPLMGPILGLGFGMAVASRRMIRASAQNLAFAVFISLLVATLYFVVSPFQDPTSEILLRTEPNLLDLLVAIAAAFAGVVAMNSTGFAGAVPGVAIATAIMPPLCASAYGIAHGDWKVALGAFYLFFVNAFAIAVVSFLLFKRLHFSEDAPEPGENGKLRPAVISLVLVLIVAPLGWSLWDAWRDNFVRRSVSRLVQNYKEKLEVVSWQWEDGRAKNLVLYNFKKTPQALRDEIEKALKDIVPQATLELHESSLSPDMEEMVTQMKTSQFSALVSNPKIIDGLLRLASTETSAGDLMTLVLKHEPEL
ncbi:MAG TPA: DUF389 domain-containing protein, partial [Oligoflexia bacterium]|nr:DUF389 domain-containing protein [Oligoflexia bacterium]